MSLTEEAVRNELAAIRLFLGLSDEQSILGRLRELHPLLSVPPFCCGAMLSPDGRLVVEKRNAADGCVRAYGHAGFHTTSPTVAAAEDAAANV